MDKKKEVGFIGNLNEKQKEAVITNGPLFVIAGAGSGKTYTLTAKVSYLIKHYGYDPKKILVLTFTNKASKELKERVISSCGPLAMNLWVFTFHAFAKKILSLHLNELGLGYTNSFSIIDDDDKKKIIRKLVKENDYDKERYTSKVVLNAINKIKFYLENGADIKHIGGPLNEKLTLLYAMYKKYCLENNLLDFDDLILYLYRLLQKKQEIREYYRTYFQYVLVDEFQDTDLYQYNILKLLVNDEKNIFVVGDPDQSIYSFRGANYANNKLFINELEAQVITLDQNYRSTQLILNAANSLIKINHENLGEQKQLKSNTGSGAKPTLNKYENERLEAFAVISKIEKLFKSGYKYSDIAILYRANATSGPFEESLASNRIPYIIYGGMSLYQRAIVKDLLAYLNLIVNAHNNFYLTRIINVPSRKIGAITLKKIEEFSQKCGTSMYDCLPEYSDKKGKIYEFFRIIQELREELRRSSDLGGFVQLVVRNSGLYDYLVNLGEEGKDGLRYLEEVGGYFKHQQDQYEVEPFLKMQNLLADLALLSSSESKDKAGDNVIVSTIHQVKGLEFKVVFLVSLEEGSFPVDVDDSADIAEERRICYVAVTRARTNLHLSYVTSRFKYGKRDYPFPSRFIEEMDLNISNNYASDFSINKDITTYFSSLKKEDIYEAPLTRKAIQLEIGDQIEHIVFKNGIISKVSDKYIIVEFLDGSTKTLEYPHIAIKVIKKD